ncbi:Eco57I restriction-modification methylase domain-containing protein [Microcoleus sp. B7-D4]|uniref:Eco57I restriction-modification methylase domain-containing protein n=1 Tax=Microcoleus sp. B7-D4 TaxID=2818696 RepID=UPI002FCFE598
MMANSLQTVDRYSWWASLKHGGLLVAPSKLAEFFPDEISPLPRHVEDRLRRDVNRVRSGDEGAIASLLDTVLEDLLQLSKDWWIKGSAVDRSWTQQAITKESIKPRRVWLDPQGGILPVFVADAESRVVARLGIGKGRRAVSRAIEWLRKANQKIALLTNGRQWRLIHAGTDYDAWCEWDIDLWFEEGQPGLQVAALRLLLGHSSLHPEKVEAPSRLIAAIAASRQGQAELSGVLGERVRLAVELLIRESGLGSRELGVGNRDIYIAATRIIMRCVVILFAEARDLLPRNNPIYHGSYGIQGLREQLDRLAGGRATERLRNGFSAWPRLLALFQLVYQGCSHEALPVPRYGGGLFTPGNPDAKDAILRSLSAFEHPENAPSDAVIYRILELLCRSKVKVRQGRSTTWVEAPVDFSDLSSEYIGILYEGLLDFELRRAGEDDPMIFLNLGDEPVLPLARLEGMDNAALSNLVEKLKKKSKLAAGEDSEAEEEETEEVEEEAEEEIEEDAALEADIEELEADLDKVQQLRERTHQWAMRAVEAGKLVAKPRGKKAEALTRYQQEVSKAGDRLIARIVLPGEWFLVRWGGTRKGSGTFYTRPQLAIPTTRRTLQPLAYQGELPKLPEEILALKVCDPAMGSGSFPVAALRFLTDALYESLHYHNRIEAHGDKSLCRLADGEGTNSLLEETLPVLPDADDFEERLKARLKRYIVERCIYGVDIDPLAVELARLSLWVETMDRTLPFSFLDHKLKCGNSLVGCWFDRFQDYPAMAWERKGGDENHEKFIYHFREFVVTQGKKQGEFRQKGDKWNQAIKDIKNSVVKKELKTLLESLMPGKPRLPYSNFKLPAQPTEIHDEAQQIFQDLHGLPIDYSSEEQKENRYQKQFRESEAIQLLKFAFDSWCAVWFWPGEEIEIAPTPARFFNPPPETAAIIEQLAQKYQFFHWELEFPDVFASANAGFDGIIGNPPWEIQKPNSMEFFSNVDPLYRTYGKQEALNKQLEYFKNDAAVERDWLAYCDRLKALSNWNKYAAFPFGDEADGGEKFSLSRSKEENQNLHEVWRRERRKRQGYAEPRHPFQHQGSADINTYKMFSELGYALLRDGGRFSLIIPSGIYSDKGTGSLRALFLNRCQWTHLYAFQNERFVFSDIDHRNKMVVFTVIKGGSTSAILTRFRLGPGDSPEAHELETDILDSKRYLSVPAKQIAKFSPKTGALLEVRTDRDLAILEKMYANSVLLGDDSPQGWGIQYATEFHMTNDSKLFPPRPQWEAKGYRPDEYGHWLKGNWQPYEAARSILQRPEGLILSADDSSALHIDEVEDVALPLYEGRMINHFDFSLKGWVRGKGRTAVWRDIPWEKKVIEPQFLMGKETFYSSPNGYLHPKIAFMSISASTNTRTTISTYLNLVPAGNSISFYQTVIPSSIDCQILSSILSSFMFDYPIRLRLGGLNMNQFVMAEAFLPKKDKVAKIKEIILRFISSVAIPHQFFATDWRKLRAILSTQQNWYQLWAITPYERLRLRCILDATVAELYGLEIDDFAWILRGCDYPTAQVCDKKFARTLEPKGFWRVDKEKDPELRHPVLSLVAFHELKRLGLETFLNLNDGEGWMLPETLRLADYDLGHDNRAKEPQPVAARLGDRFLPWQLEGTVEESWQECDRHAQNLKRLLGDKPIATETEPVSAIGESGIQLDFFNLLESQDS